MKKTFIITVDFPGEGHSLAEVEEYIISAIEEYSIETGWMAEEFNYDLPKVTKISIRDE